MVNLPRKFSGTKTVDTQACTANQLPIDMSPRTTAQPEISIVPIIVPFKITYIVHIASQSNIIYRLLIGTYYKLTCCVIFSKDMDSCVDEENC